MAPMTLKPKTIPNDIKKLQALLVEKDSQLKNLQQKYQFLLEQFRLGQHQQFGKSSEAHPDQGELFNEAEQLIDEDAASAISPKKETTRNHRNQPTRKPLPADPPRDTIIVDLTD